MDFAARFGRRAVAGRVPRPNLTGRARLTRPLEPEE